jgi:beta-lactamase regulating signal transducer with metallopeptidase domain/6-phosphogluconolactonase (cycloisomerase 2 family)
MMNLTTSEIVGTIWTHTWQITILLLLVWGVAKLVRKRPQISYLVCMVIVLKCVLPPFWSSPTSIFSWMQFERVVSSEEIPDEDPDRYVFTPMLMNTTIDEGTSSLSPISPNALSTWKITPETPVKEQAQPIPVSTILIGIWLTGAGLLVLLWSIQMIRFHRRIRRYARLSTNEELLQEVKRMKLDMSIRRNIRVLEAGSHFQTCSFGIWRPTILIPSWLIPLLSPEQRHQVIAHELIHIRRGDLFHALLQVFAQAVWWFHPLVWWFNRLMTDLRERCCDQELLSRLACAPVSYAECLLQVLKGHRSRQSLTIGLAHHPTMASSRQFNQTRERIEQIMTEPSPQYRRTPMRHWLIAGLFAAAILPGAGFIIPTQAQQPLGIKVTANVTPEKLDYVADSLVALEEIDSPTSVDVSTDGKFVYMASWSSGTLNVFERDAKTGKLKLSQTISHSDESPLNGAVHIHLSPNNQYAAVSCLHAKSFLLYARDAKTGHLSLLDAIRGDSVKINDQPVLEFPSDATWSPDGKFLYIADGHGIGAAEGESGGHLLVVQVENKKLKVIDKVDGKDNCFANARGVIFHPDGVTLFVVSSSAGTLVVMDRELDTGKISIRQIVNAEMAPGLQGVMQVACSPDGQFVYTASGRFKEGNAVCVFKLGSNGQVKLIQALSNSGGELPNFTGGNKIRVSPDGKMIYATGTNSNHLVGMQRDSKTGKLTLTQMIDGAELPQAVKGANGLAFSPDGKHLYVTWELSKGISVFDCSGKPVAEDLTRTETARDLFKAVGRLENKSLPKKKDEPPIADGPQMKTFPIQNANAAEVAKTLQDYFPPSSTTKITAVAETNGVLVYGPPNQLEMIAKEIERLDRKAKLLAQEAQRHKEREIERAKQAAIEKEKKDKAKKISLELLKLDIEEAKLQLISADQDLKRAEQLRKSNTAPESLVEEKRLAVQKAMIAIRRAELKLEQAKQEE